MSHAFFSICLLVQLERQLPFLSKALGILYNFGVAFMAYAGVFCWDHSKPSLPAVLIF